MYVDLTPTVTSREAVFDRPLTHESKDTTFMKTQETTYEHICTNLSRFFLDLKSHLNS